ncbi:MAG TPA: hypothetical protein VFW33_05280 [Gemmataceae bacterium]|nr:hypothetical protein [Gemmataceae bacterium]
MPRRFAGFVPPLFAALAVLLPGAALAGPPEGASGRMVLDEVADGLRKVRKENDPAKRLGWLKRQARTRDPRVAVALGEAMREGVMKDREAAAWLLRCEYELPLGELAGDPDEPLLHHMKEWWRLNEADLRRRAAQLPR